MKLNLKMLRHFFSAVSLLCYASTFFPATPCQAEQEPLSADVALATPATFGLGEPIMLHYKLADLSSTEKLVILRGIYNTGWYTLSMTRIGGDKVALIPHERPPDLSGLHSGDVGIYAASGRRDSWQDGYIVVSKFFAVQHPGRYLLTIHVRASYALVAPMQENPVVMKGLINSGGTTLIQDFSFPLTVTATNPAVLRAKANTLKEAIEKEHASTLLLPEVDELFCLPEAQASSVWETMALEASPMNRDLIANKLGTLRSTRAADILFKMIGNPASNSVFVSHRLSEVYNDGSPALREHIKSVAEQRGIRLPEQVSLPQVID